MGQKDLAEKNLEGFSDVFADCINALLYKGKEVLRADSLRLAPTETVYPDGRAVLRKCGYTGAVYRRQYETGEVFPVLNLILYWGDKDWKNIQSLRELVGNMLPAEADRYLNQVKVHVYHMAKLPRTVRQRFHSDMRFVVDYLAEGKDYVPGEQRIVHVDAFLRMMKVLTGDSRYEEILDKITEQNRREGIKMCEVLDFYVNKGIEQGLEQGRAAESVGYIRSLRRHELSAEKIADLISQNREYIRHILSLLECYPREDDLCIAKRLLAGE